MEHLSVEIRSTWVVLSIAFAFLSTHAAVALCEQYRYAILSKSRSFLHLTGILTFVAATFGGIGCWGVFFLVMASFRLRRPVGDIIVVQFDAGQISAAAFITLAISLVGFYVASTDECFNRNRKDIMELFISRTSKTHTIGEIKRMGRIKILTNVCTSSLERVICGGLIVGGALSLMNRLGFEAIVFPGEIEENTGLIALSVIISMLGGVGGCWVFFRVLSVFPTNEYIRTIVSGIGTVMVCGSHYAAIASLTFRFDPNKDVDGAIQYAAMVLSVLVVSVLLSFLAMVYVLVDLRWWLLQTSNQLHLADRALLSLLNRDHNDRHMLMMGRRGSRAASSAQASESGESALISVQTANNIDLGNLKGTTHEVLFYTERYLRTYFTPGSPLRPEHSFAHEVPSCAEQQHDHSEEGGGRERGVKKKSLSLRNLMSPTTTSTKVANFLPSRVSRSRIVPNDERTTTYETTATAAISLNNNNMISSNNDNNNNNNNNNSSSNSNSNNNNSMKEKKCENEGVDLHVRDEQQDSREKREIELFSSTV